MPHPDAEKWNTIYAAGEHIAKNPARVLTENRHLLPQHGKALDLACGTGANALLLARSELETHAWDVSEVAIQELQHQAANNNLPIVTEVRDVLAYPPTPQSFDVITVSYFLDRKLFPALISALKPEGLLFYQTFTREKTSDTGPRNPEYRLAPNELLQLCSGLHILVYREEGLVGNTTQGFRNEAMLIGQKRKP